MSRLRGNRIEDEGWNLLLDGLSACRQLRELNGSRAYAPLLAGGCRALDLSGREMGAAACRLLPRSASTLTQLDLRSDCARECWEYARVQRGVDMAI